MKRLAKRECCNHAKNQSRVRHRKTCRILLRSEEHLTSVMEGTAQAIYGTEIWLGKL